LWPRAAAAGAESNGAYERPPRKRHRPWPQQPRGQKALMALTALMS
jgi:hypothetical protein